ncbi:FAD-dependent oxidoreductase [Trinickia dinghuensis]|uniref:FAD-dependent oxidoreductase n=1 Tax=Trinickia dinghuensis TaxID=2291023 RepID=A0A3D8K4I0_9BURK|nr:FAD-dependent oxidoreductase [Trinickia dinghuensis]RDV00334.1 FAD-dependent oxidoreductase [Trinickia dinghuensis]
MLSFKTAQTIVEPAHSTPVVGEFDVIVLGGGPAGIAAAVSAARLGRTVLLIERYGFLGGMGTAAGVTNFCGLYANVFGEIRQVVHGVADEILAGIDKLGGLNAPHLIFKKTYGRAYDTSAFKIAADELLLSAGVEIVFHALAVGVVMKDDETIRGVVFETKSGRGIALAHMFIDCSGDGDLAAWAGASYETGDATGNTLYPSTMFRLNGVDRDRATDASREIGERMAAAEKEGFRFPRKTPIIKPQKNGSEWRANVTQLANADGSAVNGTDALQLSAGEVEGRRQIASVFRFLKTVPGFEQSYIVDIPPQVGVRETRRIIGGYQLTEADVIDCASFDDTIGVNGWPLELHEAGDVTFRWQSIPDSRGFNHLPYRMLVPSRIDNLLVAGRCASMTHEGQSAARVSGGCFVMGQAAGTAAALAIASHCAPRDIEVPALQARLERDGAYLGPTA